MTIMNNWIHPALILIVGAFLVPFLKGGVKKAYLLILASLVFVDILLMSPGTYWVYNFLGNELIFGKVDRLSLVFGYVFAIMIFIGVLYALHIEDDRQHMAALFYAGSSFGALFAGDYFTLFIFWEIMVFASVYLIFAQRSEAAINAGYRYLLVHVFGGVCLLGGIIIHYVDTGSLLFGPVGEGGVASYLILIGFLVNVGMPPLHAWLPDAYPEATITGTVFLSVFTTKVALYALLRAFPGTEMLVWFGVLMAIYGVVYATMENDFRRLLAYHMVSQLGYMVAAVGMGTELALNGSTAHAFAYIIYKALLFMATGAVIHMTGIRKLTELGGLYKTMPRTCILFMIGGFSISAFPLFSGFISKSMIVSAAAYDHRGIVVLLLTMASAGTFLSTTLKLPYYMFFGKDSGLRPKEPPRNMLLAMGVAAFLCIAIGVFPGALYSVLPFPVHYEPYTGEHITASLGLLMFTALGFFLLLKRAAPHHTVSMDTDWFYRKGSRIFLWFANKPVKFVDDVINNMHDTVLTRSTLKLAELSSVFDLRVIDSMVNAAAWLTRTLAWISHQFDIYIVDGIINSAATLVGMKSGVWRRLQTGYLQNYVLIMVIGVFIIIGSILFF